MQLAQAGRALTIAHAVGACVCVWCACVGHPGAADPNRSTPAHIGCEQGARLAERLLLGATRQQ